MIPPHVRRPVGAVLLAALRGDADPTAVRVLDGVADAELDGLVEAAGFHRVGSYVVRLLQRAGREHAPSLVALRDQQFDAAARHLLVLRALSELQAVLDGAGLDWLVVKGPVLAERAHGGADLRQYTDVDVVVPGRQLRQALAVCAEAGWSTLDRNWPLLRRELLGEVHVALGYGLHADLHWHLLYTPARRAAFPLPMDELFARRVRVPVGQLDVPTLEPADALVYTALHAALSGGERLLWLKDLERLVATQAFAWDEVTARAHAWHAGLPVGVLLDKARALIGAEVPPGVVRDLAPTRTWRGLARAARLLAPPQRRLGGGSVDRLVTRATRRDLPSSMAALARNAGSWARGSDRALARSADGQLTGPESAFYPAGDEHDREAFLDAVAREA